MAAPRVPAAAVGDLLLNKNLPPTPNNFFPLKNPKRLLIIFTKNPEEGKVKTRLAKDVGNGPALEIYNFLLKHTRDITKDLPVQKWVFYSSSIPAEDIWKEGIFEKKLQQGKDLGERMSNAFAEGFQEGFENIIIIGSDLYEITPEDISKAFDMLEKADAVIGPAKDGGYYLLGMNEIRPELFRDKTWSTSTVFNDTMANLEKQRVEILEVKNDVDTLEDIKGKEEFKKFLQHLFL